MKLAKYVVPLLVVAGVMGAISYFLSNALFASEKSLTAQVQVVDAVSSEFDYIGKPYFTATSLNPTKDISITENNNPEPFNRQ